MQETRLIQFLRSLDRSEVRDFRDFLNSPTFNKNKTVIKLFEILVKHYPEFSDSEVSPEFQYSEVYGKEKFDYHKLKNLSSDLLALGKEFLAFESYRTDNDAQELYMLKETRKRNLNLVFENIIRNAEKRIERQVIRDEKYMFHKMNLVDEHINFNAPGNPSINLDLMQYKLDHFISYSVIMLLKFYNVMLHDQIQFNHKYDLKMFDCVLEYVKKNNDETNPIMQIYYHIILLGMDKTDENFFRLKELRGKYKNKLNSVDNYMAFLYLDSYCANAFNNECRIDLAYEQFLLTKECDMNLFPELGKILYPDFIYSIKIALRVKEIDYAVHYINEFKTNLTEEKDSTLNYCYALIEHSKGETNKALELLAKTHFQSFIMKIQVKLFQLQLSYEMNFFDQTLSMIDSFRHYISRETLLLDNLKSVLLKFLSITGNLIRYRSETAIDKKGNLLKIKYDIENLISNHFGIKLWLQEKLRDIEN